MRTLRTLLFGTVLSISLFTASDVLADRVRGTCAAPEPPTCFFGNFEFDCTPAMTLNPTCVDSQPCNMGGFDLCIGKNDLCLLEPHPESGIQCISAGNIKNLGAFTEYVNSSLWKWMFGIGVAVAVLNGAEAGAMIVLSNGDSGKIESAKSRFFWSIVGLILLLLSGVLLSFINPAGFMNI